MLKYLSIMCFKISIDPALIADYARVLQEQDPDENAVYHPHPAFVGCFADGDGSPSNPRQFPDENLEWYQTPFPTVILCADLCRDKGFAYCALQVIIAYYRRFMKCLRCNQVTNYLPKKGSLFCDSTQTT